MDVDQQNVLVGTSVSSTPARGSVSKTSDIKVSELQKEIDGLKMISGAQQLRIQELEKNQRDMQEQLRAQEIYSRKDNIIILNPPYDARNVRDVTMETLKFFKSFLGITIKYEGVKACHVLPGDTGIFLPSVICKFIYFEDKTQVWKNRSALRKKVNPINQKFIILNETLPKADAEIKATAVRMGLETVTNNCIVSVAVTGENGSKKYMKVNSLDDLNKLEPNAIKRKFVEVNKSSRDASDRVTPEGKKPYMSNK